MTPVLSPPKTMPADDLGKVIKAPTAADICKLLTGLAAEYPSDLIAVEQRDVPRMTYNIRLALRYARAQPVICDVGGGICMFSLGLAALGYRSILVDDFGDEFCREFAQSAVGLHRRYGVEIMSRDVISNGLDLAPASIDVVTCFHTMEHFHNSPKRLFHQLVAALRPGGVFVLGVPNRVNLRKRVMVPIGHAPWTSMESWYEQEIFRSHVREPDVPDLRYICRDLGLEVLEIAGRNWQGHKNKSPFIRFLAHSADRTLQQIPSLCSDIYVVGRKDAK